jgi:hypothetical protein
LLLAPPGSDIARALNQLRKAQERLAAAEKQKAQAARKT